jgi:hypothetical protein
MDNKCYAPCNIKPNKQVTKDSAIPHHKRDTETKCMPKPQVNGGLYGGPQVDHPWMPLSTVPTETNYIHHQLLSANPPPGATEQYVGNIREGNNYVSKVGVYKYNNTSKLNCGPFDIEGVL